MDTNNEISSQPTAFNDMKHKLEETILERDRLVKYSQALEKLNEKYEQEIIVLKRTVSMGTNTSISKRRIDRTSSDNTPSSVLQDLLLFVSPGRNKVSQSDIKQFIETMCNHDIPQVISECFADMYCGMNKIALFIELEANFQIFRNSIVYTSQLEIEEGDADIVLDWNTCGVSVELLNNNEDDEIGYQQISFQRIQNVTDVLYIIPKCPLNRMRSSEFYACNHETLVRVLSQHGYMHMMETKGQSSSVTKSEFQEAVTKCPELIQRLRQCAAYNIGNRKKKCQETFFRLLGYGNFENNGVPVPLCECDSDVGKTNVPQVEETINERSQNCSSRLCTKRLSNRLCQFDERGEIWTNWWRTAFHRDICYVRSDSDKFNDTEGRIDENDKLFNNTASREAFKQFYCMDKEDPKEVSILYIARLDAWMTAVLERSVRRKFAKQKGGTEVRSLKHRYNSIKYLALINLQREMFRIVLNSIRADSESYETFLHEAGIQNGNEEVRYINNEDRKFTIRLRVPWFKGYYYCFKTHIFKNYICSRLGDVKDAYFGFTPSKCERIKMFHQDNLYQDIESGEEED